MCGTTISWRTAWRTTPARVTSLNSGTLERWIITRAITAPGATILKAFEQSSCRHRRTTNRDGATSLRRRTWRTSRTSSGPEVGSTIRIRLSGSKIHGPNFTRQNTFWTMPTGLPTSWNLERKWTQPWVNFIATSVFKWFLYLVWCFFIFE